jgi:hypothetical protein
MGLDFEFRRGGNLGIDFHGKIVSVRVSNIGVDEHLIEELIKSKTYLKIVKGL